MKPRMLPLDMPILDLAEEVLHTRALLRANSFLSAQATAFEPNYTRWQALMTQEIDLLHERLEAEARVIAVDDKIDFLCVAISAALLVECQGNRKSPLYQRYFGSTPPSKLKRPVLGEQLEIMRSWPPSLQEPDQPAVLKGYGAELATLVVQADTAVHALSESKRKRADHEIGPRKDFVDALNATRLTLHGDLAALPLEQPELKLDRAFADKFFIRGKSRRNPTIADVERTILRLRERLEKQEALLARLVAEEEAAQQAADNAELRAAQEALSQAQEAQAQAEQAALDAANRVQELLDQMGSGDTQGGATAPG